MRVVSYSRVSTDEQATQGVSLEAQAEKVELYCKLHEHVIVEAVTDAGVSAKTLDRPGLQRALEMLRNGEADAICVAKLDRLTRSVRDMGHLVEVYFAQKFALLSVSDQIDTSTAAGRLVLNVLTSVAQWEREAIGERTSAALQHKKSKGEHVGAPALGYQMVDGVLTEREDETETLARIRELYAEGLTLREVAASMAREGRKTKRGGDWHPQTIARVIARVGAATTRTTKTRPGRTVEGVRERT